MSPTSQIIVAVAMMFVIMLLVWVIQRVTQNAGISDVAWAGNLGLLALFYWATLETDAPKSLLARPGIIALLAAGWSFRLAIFLFFNRVWGQSEDGRYQTLRRNQGPRAQTFFLGLFQLQGLLDVCFSLPFLIAMLIPRQTLSDLDHFGIAIWLVAVLGETISDWQLARFRSRPENRGQTCRKGLWKYSRHPNYFFEWLHWWAYVCLAAGSEFWMITLLAPSLMIYLIFRVSGIPLNESQALLSRGNDYRDYQRTTNAFYPWFPSL
ncbi:MAG: conserved rane protein of unknown function [Planctomycetaceae bacterium]|nr:conserved rane protein of unknown function [Planctomycetaceae bacterium]